LIEIYGLFLQIEGYLDRKISKKLKARSTGQLCFSRDLSGETPTRCQLALNILSQQNRQASHLESVKLNHKLLKYG
jgi:hypothetical protein